MMKASDIIKKRIEFLRERANEGRNAPVGSFSAMTAGASTERLLEAKLILSTVIEAEMEADDANRTEG